MNTEYFQNSKAFMPPSGHYVLLKSNHYSDLYHHKAIFPILNLQHNIFCVHGLKDSFLRWQFFPT